MSKKFQFAISLSVLNHLGRNLYRNFVTVLGEAISNSWDAGAENVFIDIDLDAGVFRIRDDGDGMNADDFQNRFLKIGYSKRKEFGAKSESGRPFIGAKGIGKLAMLSCADQVSIFSRKEGGEIISGVINNDGLDEAIKNDSAPDEYGVSPADENLVDDIIDDFNKGTIIVFEGLRENMRASIAHIRKIIALSFRFSLVDKNFQIYVNNDPVTVADLSELSEKTEFLWVVNGFRDDFVNSLGNLSRDVQSFTTKFPVSGFIATVSKPRDLKIRGTNERATVDLFVNGRLRERNILRHIPTQRIVENYIYGHIHFDILDRNGQDPFTSSREGVLDGNKHFESLMDFLQKELISTVIDEWDQFRIDRGKDGDDENPRKSPRARKAAALYNETAGDFLPEEGAPSDDLVSGWLQALRGDAEFNLTAYAECFLAENLLRQFIISEAKPKIKGFDEEVKSWRGREAQRKGEANISFSIRDDEQDIAYLGLDWLAKVAEGGHAKPPKGASLHHDSVRYTPIRNAVGHTGRLSKIAKADLTTTYENIKARIRIILSINVK